MLWLKNAPNSGPAADFPNVYGNGHWLGVKGIHCFVIHPSALPAAVLQRVQKSIVHCAARLRHPCRAIRGEGMVKEAQHRSHKTFFIHDIAAPDAVHALRPHGGPPPVHDCPQRLRHFVDISVAGRKVQGGFLIIHGSHFCTKPLAHHGGEAQTAAYIQTVLPGNALPLLRKLGANNRTQAVLLAGKLAVDPKRVVAQSE